MNFEQSTDFFLPDDDFNFNNEKYNYSLPLFNSYPQKDFEYPFTLPSLEKKLSLSQFPTNLSREEPNHDFNMHEDHQPQWMIEQYPYKIESNLPFQAYSNPSPRDDFTGLTTKLIREMSHLDKGKIAQMETGSLYLSDAAGESFVDTSESSDNEDLENQKNMKEEKEVKEEIKEKEVKEVKEEKEEKEVKEELVVIPKCDSSKKIKKAVKYTKKLKESSSSSSGSSGSSSSSSSKVNLKKSKISLSTHDNVKNQKKSSKMQIDGCNNIVKNYGKAMATFAISEAAIPYLQSFLNLNRVKYERFTDFIYSHKESIDCIGSLRNLLLINEEDSDETAVYKNIFKEICLIFLKYFAVNWIYNGKMTRKREHLNCRFHLMRRISKPSQFTYLK